MLARTEMSVVFVLGETINLGRSVMPNGWPKRYVF